MTDQRTTEWIPLTEEELRVEKRHIPTGKVRVRSVVDVVEEVAHATLEEERVEVTRVPVGKEIDIAPPVRTDGDAVIVPIVEEILVVEKRLVLKEELHIRRDVTQENVELPVTLRKHRAVVERVSPEGQVRVDEEIKT
jgi:uncharacterized protein (TIGR02271 family)